MRTVSEMLTDRSIEIRCNAFYRMQLALRDLNDVHLHPDLPDITEPPKEIQPIFRPRPVDKEIDQLKAKINQLERRLYQSQKLSKNKVVSTVSGREDITDRLLGGGQ